MPTRPCPTPTATPRGPPDPDDRLDVPVTVWLSPPLPASSARRHNPPRHTARSRCRTGSWPASPTSTPPRSRAPRRGCGCGVRPPAARSPPAGPACAGIVVDLTGAVRGRHPCGRRPRHRHQRGGVRRVRVRRHRLRPARRKRGPLVRVKAAALGLAYVQHLIAVNGHADGDRIVPHPGDARPTTDTAVPTGRPVHVPVHTDLLVFRTPAPDVPSGAGR
ncbi:hypothetical protein ACU686_09980 [Yinghuangia aomiensis]